MAQIYAQQAKAVGASPDSNPISAKSMNEQDSVQNKAHNEEKQSRSQNSDVSDEEVGEDLPC